MKLKSGTITEIRNSKQLCSFIGFILSHKVVSSTPCHKRGTIGTDCIGSCKSNYNTITTMTTPQDIKHFISILLPININTIVEIIIIFKPKMSLELSEKQNIHVPLIKVVSVIILYICITFIIVLNIKYWNMHFQYKRHRKPKGPSRMDNRRWTENGGCMMSLARRAENWHQENWLWKSNFQQKDNCVKIVFCRHVKVRKQQHFYNLRYNFHRFNLAIQSFYMSMV